MYRTDRYRAVLPKGDRRRSIEEKLRREEEEEKKKRKRRKKKKRKRKGTSSRPRPRAVATRGSPASRRCHRHPGTIDWGCFCPVTARNKSVTVWINLGPLLYHFADSYGPEDVCEMSIELSLEDVKKIAFHYGFVMEKERVIETTYTANPRSMMQLDFVVKFGSATVRQTDISLVFKMQNQYYAAFWTMRKSQ
ncbi:hypothetical protein GW17_00011016 [Ensete ventricosum]|nr:hypothetical protein GW17_00011016 [Ensete ventricosum]